MWSGHSCPLPLTLNRVERTSGLARPFLLTEQQRQGMPHSFRVLCGKVGSQDSQVKTTAQVARLRPDSRVHVNSQGCPVQARLGGDFSRQRTNGHQSIGCAAHFGIATRFFPAIPLTSAQL
jgi:hypothetical protein